MPEGAANPSVCMAMRMTQPTVVLRSFLPAVLRRVSSAAVTTLLAAVPSLVLAAPSSAQAPAQILLPSRLPAHCIQSSADDFGLPASVLLAMIKVESNGYPVVSRNANGTWDIGVAQHNSASWVPYFERRYGITAQALTQDVCLSVRAQAYVLRSELRSRQCGGADLWCAVARYHSPRNHQAQQRYLTRVRAALHRILSEGRFETAGQAAR